MKFLDFFSGIGGFRLGMEMAGHECLGHCEIDKYANISYNAMHKPKEGEWFATDIRGVEPRDIPSADIYCFGFPCQSFSIAGKRGGFEDTRGTLFFEVMRLARVRKPKYLFAENVTGLLSHDDGRTFWTILNVLRELGYYVQYQVLNSKNFGVPQNRERVFIVGHLGGKPAGEIFPIGCSNEKTLDQLIGGSQGNRVYGVEGVSVTLSSEGGGQGAKTGLYMINTIKYDRAEFSETSKTIRAGGEHDKRPYVMAVGTSQDVHGVMVFDTKNAFGGCKTFDNISPTLTSNHYKEPLKVTHGVRIRKLIPLECFRLQGFPDEYFYRAKEAGISDSQLYKQAGNSVTVNVIYEIARRLI